MRAFSNIQLAALITCVVGAMAMGFITYQLHELDAGWLPEFTTALTALFIFMGVQIVQEGESC